MAVRIRLTRTGRRNRACYRIGAFDSRTRRDGRCLEILGLFFAAGSLGTPEDLSTLGDEEAVDGVLVCDL